MHCPPPRIRSRHVSDSQQMVTRLLAQAAEGEREAAAELLPLVYDELRALAVHYGVDPDDTSPPPPMPAPSAAKPKGGATEMV